MLINEGKWGNLIGCGYVDVGIVFKFFCYVRDFCEFKWDKWFCKFCKNEDGDEGVLFFGFGFIIEVCCFELVGCLFDDEFIGVVFKFGSFFMVDDVGNGKGFVFENNWEVF